MAQHGGWGAQSRVTLHEYLKRNGNDQRSVVLVEHWDEDAHSLAAAVAAAAAAEPLLLLVWVWVWAMLSLGIWWLESTPRMVDVLGDSLFVRGRWDRRYLVACWTVGRVSWKPGVEGGLVWELVTR